MKKNVQKRENAYSCLLVLLGLILLVGLVSRFPWSVPDDTPEKSLNYSKIELDKDSYLYTGMEIEASFNIWVDGELLEEDKDYSLKYYENLYPGTAFVMISGTGSYDGECFASYPIVTDNDLCDDLENRALVKYVLSWYRTLFVDREATRDELVYWVEKIKNKEFSSKDFMVKMFDSPNSDVYRYDEDVLVRKTYQALLRRNPDKDSADMWIEMFEIGEVSRQAFICSIVDSPEFMNILLSFSVEDDVE